MTLLRTLSVGYIGKHPLRTVLVILSIALGVTMLVATQALKAGINKGIQEGVNPLGGLADLIVVNGQTGVPYEAGEGTARRPSRRSRFGQAVHLLENGDR